MSKCVYTTLVLLGNAESNHTAMLGVKSEIDHMTNHFDLNTLVPTPSEFSKYVYQAEESLVYFLTDRLTKPLDEDAFNQYNPSKYELDADSVLKKTKKLVGHYDKQGVGHFSAGEKQAIPLGTRYPKTLDELYSAGQAVVAVYNQTGFSNIFDWAEENWGVQSNTEDSTQSDNCIYFTQSESIEGMISLFAEKYNLDMIAYYMDDGRYEWGYLTYKGGELIEHEESDEEMRLDVEIKIFGKPDEYEDD